MSLNADGLRISWLGRDRRAAVLGVAPFLLLFLFGLLVVGEDGSLDICLGSY